MPDRVEVTETTWKVGLPDERSRRVLQLIFGCQVKRDDDENGEADDGEGKAA